MNKFFCLSFVVSSVFCVSCTKTDSNLEEFEKKVGIHLCKGSRVEKIELTKFDDETDFSYNANVFFPKKCKKSITDQIIKISASKCDESINCIFFDKRMWFYSFEMQEENEFQIKLRAT